jgi:hypothetical protein
MSSADMGLPSGAIGSADNTNHRGVALEEDLFHEVRDREAEARVLFSTVSLREAGPELPRLTRGRVDAVLEEVALNVEHELVPGEGGAGGVAVGARGGRDLVLPARLAATLRLRFLVRARVEDQQGRRRSTHREQELSARNARSSGVAVARFPGSADRLLDDG